MCNLSALADLALDHGSTLNSIVEHDSEVAADVGAGHLRKARGAVARQSEVHRGRAVAPRSRLRAGQIAPRDGRDAVHDIPNVSASSGAHISPWEQLRIGGQNSAM